MHEHKRVRGRTANVHDCTYIWSHDMPNVLFLVLIYGDIPFKMGIKGHMGIVSLPSLPSLTHVYTGWSSVVQLGAIDCSTKESYPTCSKYGIRGYPTMRVRSVPMCVCLSYASTYIPVYVYIPIYLCMRICIYMYAFALVLSCG